MLRSRIALVGLLLAGCRGDAGPGDGGSRGGGGRVTRYDVRTTADGSNGFVISRTLVSTISGGHVVSHAPDNMGEGLVSMDFSTTPPRFAYVKRMDGAMNFRAIAPDGAGGVFLAGRGMGVRVARVSAAGAVLWANSYDNTSAPLPFPTLTGSTFGREHLSEVHNGRVVVTIAGSVLVLDAETGTPIWRRDVPGNVSGFQPLASDEGITLAGSDSAGMFTIRFDWSGTQLGATSAEAPPGTFSFGQPIRRADGGFVISYLYKDGGTRTQRYGMLAFANDGTKLSQWTYTFSAMSFNGGEIRLDNGGEIEPFQLQSLAGGNIWVDMAPRSNLRVSEDTVLAERVDLAFPVSGTGTVLDGSPTAHDGRIVRIDETRFASFGRHELAVGDWNTRCAAADATVEGLVQSFDARPNLTFTPTMLSPATRTVTATPFNLELTDVTGGTITPQRECVD